MTRSSQWRWLKCLVTTLALTLAGASSATEPAPTQQGAKYEVRFMTNMIDHHMMAIMMAEHCLEKATVHPELQAMCANIIETQTAEMEEMQAWLDDWYRISYEPEVAPSMQHTLDRLSAMSPEEFEIHFMQMMVRHHWKAVIEGEHCVDRASHPELLQTCGDIVTAQSEEIATMQTWLCEWYARCQQGPQAQ